MSSITTDIATGSLSVGENRKIFIPVVTDSRYGRTFQKFYNQFSYELIQTPAIRTNQEVYDFIKEFFIKFWPLALNDGCPIQENHAISYIAILIDIHGLLRPSEAPEQPEWAHTSPEIKRRAIEYFTKRSKSPFCEQFIDCTLSIIKELQASKFSRCNW